MHAKDIPALKIGNLEINPPIIRGRVARVSRANLAAAVANKGAVGVITSPSFGRFGDFAKSKFSKVN